MDARQLQALYANLPVGVLMVAPDGTVIEANRHVEKMFGLRAGSDAWSVGNWTLLRSDGTAMPEDETPMARVLSGEAVVRDVEVGVEWDESVQWLRVTAAAMPALDGGGAVVVIEDVTALHEAEERRHRWQSLLEVTREHLAMACDAADLTLWRYDHVDRTTKIVRGGAVLARAGVELTNGTFRPAELAEMIVPSQRDEYLEVTTRARQTGRPYEISVCIATTDGDHLWLLERGQPDPEEPTVVLGGTLDVTAQVEDRRARELAEDRLASILDTVPDVISVAEADGTLLYVSPSVSSLLGEPPAALVGRVVEGLVATEAIAAHEAPTGTVVERMRVAGAEGDQVWLETTTRATRGPGGRTQFVSVSRDVTEEVDAVAELERLRVEAERSTRTKSSFLANISHEIRTPMNAIIGMTQLALETELSQRQQRYVERVQQSAESLMVIINDLLDYSKFEAGKLELEDIDFRLDEVLDGFRTTIGLAALGRGVELLFDVDLDIPIGLRGDPLRLGQILTNLGSNAVKFTEPGGEVVLQVSLLSDAADGVELLFRVTDTGLGMHPDQLEHLFEPFTQAEVGTTREFGGTGLGLAIVRQLVDHMGGEVSVTSQPGTGSAFEVVLTFSRSDQPVGRYRDPRLAEDRPRTLVVDDRPPAREIHVRLLEGLGLRVDQAADGVAALELILTATAQEDPYELLVADWQMPGMDGIELTSAMGKQAQAVPTVLMVTAHDRSFARAEAENKGVAIGDFLEKPTTPSMLHDAIMNALGHDVFRRAQGRDLVADVDSIAAPVQGAHVLLVEDNRVNQELAVELLERQGVRVTVARDGQEALDVLEERPFDVVLMDCQMPNMDGYEATRRLRQRSELDDLPVIAMTANAMAADRDRALDAGMDDHVAKPIDVQELWSKLARWVHGRETSPSAHQGGATSIDGAAEAPDLRLDGVDVEEGLRICRGDMTFYRRLLDGLVTNQGDAAVQVRAALDEGDHEAASMAAHALRGVAANLRAKELATAAGELEEACQAGDDEAARAALATTSALLDRFVEQVRALDDVEVESTDDVAGLLPRLRAHVEAYDPEATRLVEELVVDEGSRVAAHLRGLAAALRQYDFDEARVHLDHIEQVLTD